MAPLCERVTGVMLGMLGEFRAEENEGKVVGCLSKPLWRVF